MRLEKTLTFRSYLCQAKICGTLKGDNLGSEGWYDDSGYFDEHLAELFGADIDRVFRSQVVKGVFGDERWAFADPDGDVTGGDLHARLFHDRDHDAYYLAFPPTKTRDDKVTDLMTAAGLGVPDQYKQALQLVELVRPAYRNKLVLSGMSLGGGLAAYAALWASWPVRTIVFDPLGLNRNMMGRRGRGWFGQLGVLSDDHRGKDAHIDWYYIEKSWLAQLNVDRHLSSVGKVTELPQDPVRAANNVDTHDLRYVREGLCQLWGQRV